jgi:flagellar basal body-associated protein FliL
MSRKEILILLLCIVILALPLYMNVFVKISPFSFFARQVKTTKTDTETYSAEEPLGWETDSETEEKIKSTGIYYQMGSFVVNIAHTEAQRFLKTVIVVELDNKNTSKEIGKKVSLIRDAIVTILSDKDFPDIEGADRKDKLRREIMELINSKLETGRVINVYFEEFVAQ